MTSITLNRKHTAATVLAFLVLFSLAACADSAPTKPTPEAAKQFLKLRGYDYDEESFLSAAKTSDVAAVNAFVAAGIDLNAKDADGATALISAAARGDAKIVAALLKGGADVNRKDQPGHTAIMRALEHKEDAVADLILAKPELDLNVQGGNGVTALMFYVWREREDVVPQLIERGAKLELQDAGGDTALHGAAQRGNARITELLLAKGANPNVKNKVGGTPLMWAAIYDHQDVARLLLEKGADPNLKDDDGLTAAAWAAKNKRTAMAELLNDAAKKQK
jgi:ankyrin repeat protein